MNDLNLSDISQSIAEWNRQALNGEVFGIDNDSVSKALSIVQGSKVASKSDTFLYLSALNLLNAAIKKPEFKGKLSYSVIKSNAGRLIREVDNLKGSKTLKETCFALGYTGVRNAIDCLLKSNYEFKKGDTSKHEPPLLIRSISHIENQDETGSDYFDKINKKSIGADKIASQKVQPENAVSMASKNQGAKLTQKRDSVKPNNYPNDETHHRLYNLGYVQEDSWSRLSALTGQPNISINNIENFLVDTHQYLNGDGYPKFPNDTPVTAETGKFIYLKTNLMGEDGMPVVGWFTKDSRAKDKTSYTGISWGNEHEFRSTIKINRENFVVGRMIFKDKEECMRFFESLKSKVIPEPWAYKNRKESDFKYPILKSYLQFELDRLFYEQEVLNLSGKILTNAGKDRILFNTNLINKFGDDLFIVGRRISHNGKSCLYDLEVAPPKAKLAKYGYKTSEDPKPPQFFRDINEIVFHCSWVIDKDMDKREHIINDRKERFPKCYRELRPEDLGQKLNNAIKFATKIAQRNYKFIVPMYYPTRQRIQLLMPIYLDTTYSNHPDFALVLTPDEGAKLYIPETILGLDEVYQDARLIAKPEESWLNPDMIE